MTDLNPISYIQKDRLRSNDRSYFNNSIQDLYSSMVGWLLIFASIISMIVFAYGSWDYFINICPNTDLLTWDENIRLVTVYDQYSDFLNGNILSGLKPFFEAPTWPPLRSLITFTLLYFPDFLLVTEWDSLVGLMFLVATYLSLIAICYKLTSNWLFTGILSLSGFALLFQTIEVSAYSLSSMLETQSMFFLLWCYYYFYRMYEDGETLQRSTILGLSIFLLCFFFTKYPYGLMLFIALFVVEFFRNYQSIKKGVGFAISHHYRGGRILLLGAGVLFIASIPFLRLIEGVDFNQRTYKLPLYFVSLLVFLDFLYFTWKHRNALRSFLPVSIRVLYLYSFLPSMIWIYGNPDRVMSLLDAQMIVNEYTKSFFLSIVATRSSDPMLPMAVYDNPWGIRILLIFAFLSSVYIFLQSTYGIQKIKERLVEFFNYPLFNVTSLLFLQILILETTTGNKQLRHILQYLPALTLILWLWIFQGFQVCNSFNFSHIRNRIAEIMISIAFLATIIVLSGNNGLWSGNFFKDRYFCLRGEDENVFEPVRWVDSILPKDKNLLLFNGFHERFNYDKTGRLIASEFDLKIRESRFRFTLVRNDNRHKLKSWDRFDELVFISYSCDDPLLVNKLKIRSEKVSASLVSIGQYHHFSHEYCVERFKINKQSGQTP